MSTSERKSALAKPHYVVRRSRMGRFNFTLLAAHGRITGVVVVPIENRTKQEIEQEAHRKIRALAGELANATEQTDPIACDLEARPLDGTTHAAI
ncbi:hypothetical protein G3T14_17350 [Methylobacterium sp. BTF04]|uniref:hypothetical protein n=1 Tax=Methylobacterium sp. BTF04 TaxID=2708300 RepID=UPI0013D83E56|nr:hypothetical protein [Methylobacterium sp. BTF04]NEU13879.1 hypothetical protein [Methylobacterium sp. BTF04]